MELGHWPNESWTKKVNKAILYLNLQRKLCGTENQIFHAIKTSVFHIVQNKSPAIYSIFIWLLAQVSSICFCNVLVNTINYFNIWTIDRIKLLIDTWPQILHMKSGQVKITLISAIHLLFRKCSRHFIIETKNSKIYPSPILVENPHILILETASMLYIFTIFSLTDVC